MSTARCPVVVHEDASAALALESAANFIARRLSHAIDRRGYAVLAVSGGRSPQALLEQLSLAPLAWSKVMVVLVDDRAVGVRHPLSNAGAIRGWLLRNDAAEADFRSFVPDSAEAGLEIKTLSDRASSLFPSGAAIDVAVLGMGLDGHIASIFPAMDHYEAMIDPANPAIYAPVRLSNPPSEAPVDRVSLTMARLIEAHTVVLPLAGVDKRLKFEQCVHTPDDALPMSVLIRRRRLPIDVFLSRT